MHYQQITDGMSFALTLLTLWPILIHIFLFSLALNSLLFSLTFGQRCIQLIIWEH